VFGSSGSGESIAIPREDMSTHEQVCVTETTLPYVAKMVPVMGTRSKPSAIAKESVERLRVACEGARVVVHGCYLFARLHISPRRAPSFPGARVLSRTL
jgi:hypothetical protein